MPILGPILFFLFFRFTTPSLDLNVAHLNKLAQEQISLEKRYDNAYVNNVFKDNILLNVAYLDGKVKKKEDINWDEIRKPINYKFTLKPKETFAFHSDILPQYENTVVKTTNANFNFDDGFKSDGYLTGDGVCHFASLIYWSAKKAGLDAYAPTNHDFHQIPEIAKEYGVAIFKSPDNSTANAMQNLYVTNNKNNPIVFNLEYKNNELIISIFEDVKRII